MNLNLNNWNALRTHYAHIKPLILATPKNEWAVDAYDWENKGLLFMTPIEAWLWADMRAVGTVFYPQYPVGRVFVDFANPKAKVAIECDGAAFHLDVEKDKARDAVLVGMGWAVYRAPGWLCRTDQDRETGTSSDAMQFVRHIAMKHRLCPQGYEESVVASYTRTAERKERERETA